MFSATFNKECRQVAREYLENDHIRIRVGRVGSTHANIVQKVRTNPSLCVLIDSSIVQVIYADEDVKKKALYDLLLSMPPARTLIFVNSKHQADFVDDYLYNNGLPSTSIHSGRNQREREDAM